VVHRPPDAAAALVAAAALLLGTSVAAEAPLMAAGLDSIGATEFAAAAGRALATALPSTLVFDHPSAAAAAAFATPKDVGPGSGVTASGSVADRLVRVAAALLGTAVAADAPLMAAGLDSIGAGEFAAAAGEALATALPSTLVFDHPSAASVARACAPAEI